jgi:hypothetical protein
VQSIIGCVHCSQMMAAFYNRAFDLSKLGRTTEELLASDFISGVFQVVAF